jgi:hypothetical protein
MTEIKRTKLISIEPPIFMELKSLAHTLATTQQKTVDYEKKFLVFPYVHSLSIWDSKKREIIDLFDVPRTYYSPAKEYKEYLIVRGNKEVILDDKSDSGDLYLIKVINHRDHELGDLDKRILEAIDESEKKRKSN